MIFLSVPFIFGYRQLNVYIKGEFVMYKSTVRDFEVSQSDIKMIRYVVVFGVAA